MIAAAARRAPARTVRRRPPADREARPLDAVHDRGRAAGRPSARASSTASATPRPCVERQRGRGSSGSRRASMRCTVPAAAPDMTASASHTRSAPSQASSSDTGSALQQTTATPSGTRVRRNRGGEQAGGVVAALAAAHPDDSQSRLSRGRCPASGSGSSTRCRGRSCGSSARTGASSRSSGTSSERSTTARRSSSIVPWFCDVGGMMSASRMVPSRPSCSGGRGCRAGPRVQPWPVPARGCDLERRHVRLLVGGDQPQRLVGGVHELDAAHDDAAERVSLGRLEPHLARRLACDRRELVGVQREPGQRAAQVAAALADGRVQGVRPGHVAPRRSGRGTPRRRCRGRALETIRPRSIGYSPGWRRQTSS